MPAATETFTTSTEFALIADNGLDLAAYIRLPRASMGLARASRRELIETFESFQRIENVIAAAGARRRDQTRRAVAGYSAAA